MSYTFRLRFKVSTRKNFDFSESEILVFHEGGIRITLQAHEKGKSIKQSDQFVLEGDGYSTSEDAINAGELSRDRLTLAFSELKFPADFGDRIGKSFFTDYGLKMFESEAGTRLLNDIHGLQVYETKLNPKFASLNFIATITQSKDNVLKALKKAFSITPSLNDNKRLAFELFSAAFFSTYVDARFILLMMAVETLIEPALKPGESQKLIDELLELVRKSKIKDRNSIIGGLENLRFESISSLGKKLASKVKGKYLDMSPSDFFSHCYRLRGKLVHGSVPRLFKEIGDVIGPLENLTTDLICYPDFNLEE